MGVPRVEEGRKAFQAKGQRGKKQHECRESQVVWCCQNINFEALMRWMETCSWRALLRNWEFPFKSRDMPVFIYQLKALCLPETLVSCYHQWLSEPTAWWMISNPSSLSGKQLEEDGLQHLWIPKISHHCHHHHFIKCRNIVSPCKIYCLGLG